MNIFVIKSLADSAILIIFLSLFLLILNLPDLHFYSQKKTIFSFLIHFLLSELLVTITNLSKDIASAILDESHIINDVET